MIDLVQTASACPSVQTVPTDPGTSWAKNPLPAIEPPPDHEVDPAPEAKWPAAATRTGVYGVVSPRILALTGGGYRMYYTQILPRHGSPAGANDYDTASSRILSATSHDGETWSPEAGVRLSPQQGGAGDFRVVSSEVVPIDSPSGRFRMYYECCNGPQSQQNSIRSAISDDGLVWSPERGARIESAGVNVNSPRIIILDDGRCRLYFQERGKGIVSAVSDDGLRFRPDSGIRIAPNTPNDRFVAFAPEILRIAGAGYRMYYAGHSTQKRAQILTAVSADGLTWDKETQPVIAPNGTGPDAAKCSEMCVIRVLHHQEQAANYRMFYEACDGTAQDRRGVWRIASAKSAD